MDDKTLDDILYSIGNEEVEFDTALVTKAKEEIIFRNFYKITNLILGLNFILTIFILVFLNLSLGIRIILISYFIFSQGLIAFSVSLLRKSKLSLRGTQEC